MKLSVRRALLALCVGVVAILTFGSPGSALALKRITNIPLQNYPRDLAINPKTNRLYAVDNSSFLSIISTKRNRLRTTLEVGGNLTHVVVNPETNYIYAAGTPTDGSPYSSVIYVIDGTRQEVLGEIGLSQTFRAMDLDPVRNRLYVVTLDPNGNGVLTAYDLNTNQSVMTVELLVPLQHVAVNPATNMVYVEAGGDSIVVVDGADGRLLTTISLTGLGYTSGLAVNPLTNRIYAALYESDRTAVIDGATNTVIAAAPTGITPTDIMVNPTTNHVYIANGEMNTVTVFDCATNELIADLPMSAGGELAVHPRTNQVYKSYHGDGAPGIVVLDDTARLPAVGQTWGEGTIIDAYGIERAFRFYVERTTETGAISGFVEYQLSDDMTFRREEITNLVLHRHRASFSTRVDGVPVFAVTVVDNSRKGVDDTFTIAILSDGSFHGSTLTSGNVEVKR